MVMNGRGNNVPPDVVEDVLRLYCEPHHDDPDRWLFTIADICRLMELDPKTVRKVLRTEGVKMFRERLLQG